MDERGVEAPLDDSATDSLSNTSEYAVLDAEVALTEVEDEMPVDKEGAVRLSDDDMGWLDAVGEAGAKPLVPTVKVGLVDRVDVGVAIVADAGCGAIDTPAPAVVMTGGPTGMPLLLQGRRMEWVGVAR
jgi:hypothetical protein